MKRQGLIVSIDELRELADDLERQCRNLNLELDIPRFDYKHKFQVNIINFKGYSDTWKLEDSQKTSYPSQQDKNNKTIREQQDEE